MSTQLDDDIRTAFAQLAATTTISPDVRFGDIENRVAPSSRRRWPMLVAAAACVALVIGLAVAARDRTPEAPAPADTTIVPVETPQFLFPEPGSEVRFDDPVTALEAYLADRMSNVITVTTPPFDGGEDQLMLSFSLTVTPDDPTLCCDSGDGVAYLELVDGGWFVRSAEITAMQVTELSYSDDGVVTGTVDPTIGGTYVVSFDAFGWPAPTDFGFVGEHDPATAPGGFTFESRGQTAPAVGVRIWRQPNAAHPDATPVFAEYLMPRGTRIDGGIPMPISELVDQTVPVATVAGPVTSVAPPQTQHLFPLGDGPVFDDPIVALDAYLTSRATTAPEGRTVTFQIAGEGNDVTADRAVIGFNLLVTPDDPELCCDSADGVALLERRSITDGTAGGWAVVTASIMAMQIDEISYHDGVVEGTFTTSGEGRYRVTIEDAFAPTNGDEPQVGRVDDVEVEATEGVSTPFRSEGFTADAVVVRIWHVGAGEQSFPYGYFAEVLVPEGAVRVPPLIGLTEAQARDTLERAGLTANVTYVGVPAGDDHDGTVIEQDLVAGSLIGLGTAIEVSVAVAATP